MKFSSFNIAALAAIMALASAPTETEGCPYMMGWISKMAEDEVNNQGSLFQQLGVDLPSYNTPNQASDDHSADSYSSN